MNVKQLKEKVEAYRKWLRESARASVVAFSENGPVSMGLIDALVETVESQERRIADLERRIAQR